MGTEFIEIDAVNGVYGGDDSIVIQSNRFTSISYSKPIGGTATAGTITIEGKVPGAFDYEAITGISAIDLAAPLTQTIENTPVSHLKLTLAGFIGTATKIKLAVNTFDFRV